MNTTLKKDESNSHTGKLLSKAVILNTTLKKDESNSHTGKLLSVVDEIMSPNGISVQHIHKPSHQIPSGVYPNMTEHSWDIDDWPTLWEKAKVADISIIDPPVWLGEESSVCRVLIERLCGMSGMLNDKGQSIF